ncbi:YkyB family protein, partial [Litchfieldia salsa]
MRNQDRNNTLEQTVDNLARAIFIVNKHAKAAPNPKFLYLLKRKALE